MPGTKDVKPNYTRGGRIRRTCWLTRAGASGHRPIMVAMGLLPIFRTEELRRVEAAARGLPLMERAGLAAADVARRHDRARDGSVLVLAGPGNNGGDAFVVARRLRELFFDVAVVFRGDAARLPADAGNAHRAFVDAGGTTITDTPAGWRGSLIVDGLFGIGLARPLAAEYASLVERANGSGIPILALDVPSGLDADTGAARGPTIRAAATATFLGLKPGLLTGDGIDCCGDVSVHALGLETEATTPAAGHRLDWHSLAADLPAVLARRVRNVHKGSFGTLAIIGGADGMVGAPLLAGRAALHAGAGKVWIGFVAGHPPAVDWGQPELMLRQADEVVGAGASAMVCGPGLGVSASAKAILARAIAERVPLVLDADALNAIAANRELAVGRRTTRGAYARHTPSRRSRAPARHGHRSGTGGPAGRRAGARHETSSRRRPQGRGQRPCLSGRDVGHQRQRQPGPRERRHR